MYPEIGNNAISASKLFREKMKAHPGHWGDNLLESVENLKDPDEQIKFLAWMSDPQGKCRKQNENCKPVPMEKELDLSGFTITGVRQGKYPTYQIVMNKDVKAPVLVDDEKSPA